MIPNNASTRSQENILKVPCLSNSMNAQLSDPLFDSMLRNYGLMLPHFMESPDAH